LSTICGISKKDIIKSPAPEASGRGFYIYRKVNRFKKHISIFLLSVLGFATIPTPLFHTLFADHTDAAENHCQYYHKELGRHIEEQQDHCDVFKAITPLYDAVKVNYDLKVYETLVQVYKVTEVSSIAFSAPLNLPARAPPVA